MKTKEYNNILVDAFTSQNKVYGRVRLSQFIAKKHNIYINSRALKRNMNRLGLKCEIRRKRKEREKKDTIAKFENILNRDYNDNQNRNIYATDVTYIERTRDSKQNHVFLSAIISYKTKQIIGWKLSTNNDLNFVLDNVNGLLKIIMVKYHFQEWVIHLIIMRLKIDFQF
ncbi:hypothetical protein QLQ80_02575 [Mycoplasma sp. M5725]|uniref:HTH-like domain-containing protein n=1 Tax=Mycoplasma phocimorsus TaxID=3045839 RepID=A0AAJ1PSZ6_9MOLU|nr:hypothetical protein [Mycoplasma phocimorsus]MDJ1645954.1 hypothetical protein [Mycoplasma phocimorsus]